MPTRGGSRGSSVAELAAERVLIRTSRTAGDAIREAATIVAGHSALRRG